MKHLLLSLALLVTAAPLFANDEGGDYAYIPSYQELVREGYGPRYHYAVDYDRAGPNMTAAVKPTQAYYTKGSTIYYGYTVLAVRAEAASGIYAFGYPVDYFSRKMPGSVNEVNLSHYAMSVPNQTSPYGPGDFVAKARSERAQAVTTVQSTRSNTAPANGANPLPAIGEKPAH